MLCCATMASFRNMNNDKLAAFENNCLYETESLYSNVVQKNIELSLAVGQSEYDSSDGDHRPRSII